MPFDLLSSFPFDWMLVFPPPLMVAEETSTPDADAADLSQLIRIVRIVKLLRLLRIARLFRYLNKFEDSSPLGSLSGNLVRLVKLTIFMFLFCHWNGNARHTPHATRDMRHATGRGRSARGRRGGEGGTRLTRVLMGRYRRGGSHPSIPIACAALGLTWADLHRYRHVRSHPRRLRTVPRGRPRDSLLSRFCQRDA